MTGAQLFCSLRAILTRNRRKHEDDINSFPHFWANVPAFDSTIGIHFVALFSQKPDAVPLLLLHGWPGSFLEFLGILRILRERYPDPKTLPYHVIVPSLPGYALSDAPPLNRDFDFEDIARIFDHLLVQILGLKGYIGQAGDVGSRVVRILAAQYEHCRGTHLNLCNLSQPEGKSVDDLEAYEKKGLERYDQFKAKGAAYAQMHATRPGTIGLALSSSPLALLSWVGEKFLEWTDPDSFPADAKLPETQVPYSTALMREALLSVSLYWFSGHAHTNLYSYRHVSTTIGGKDHSYKGYHIHAPKKLGYSYFPHDIAPTPKSWVATTGNLVDCKIHDKGGHFAALELPEVLLADFEDFVAKVVAE